MTKTKIEEIGKNILTFFKKHKILIPIIAASLAVVVCASVFLFRGSPKKQGGQAVSSIALTEGFTDVKVTDNDSAVKAAMSVANILGIDKDECSLEILDVNNLDQNNYYRMQQYFKGIPVYGRRVSICADNDGNAVALTANTVNIEDDFSIKADKNEKKIKNALKKYFSNELDGEINELNISDDSWDNRVIYTLGKEGESHLAYYLNVSFKVSDDLYTERLIVDCKTGEVLCRPLKLYNVDEYVKSKDGKNSAMGWYEDGEYFLYNDKYKISVFDFKGKAPWRERETVESDFSQYGYSNLSSSDNKFDDNAIAMLSNTIDLADFYNDLGDGGFHRINVAINDGYQDGKNALGAGWIDDDENRIAAMFIGKVTGTNDIDVLAHEYTHCISKSIVGWADSLQSGALNEGYSDIFGELIEQKVMHWNNPDWCMKGDNIPSYRNIANPSEKGYPVQANDANNSPEDFTHAYSTVISHAAYLMWNGIDGDESKKIDSDKLAHLWYDALYLMPSDANFSQCRNVIELTARIMLQNKELTREQCECVSQAFDSAKIKTASYRASQSFKNEFDLEVVNSKKNSKVNFNLTVTKIPDDLMGEPYKVFEESYLLGNQHLSLENGRYIITVTDLSDSSKKPIKVIILVDGNNNESSSKLEIHTDFTEETAKVTGTVKDSETGDPIYAVSVEVVEKNHTVAETIGRFTDKNGIFEFSELPFGEYDVYIQHADYQTAILPLSVDSYNVVLSDPILLKPINKTDIYGEFIKTRLSQSGAVDFDKWKKCDQTEFNNLNSTGMAAVKIADLNNDSVDDLLICSIKNGCFILDAYTENNHSVVNIANIFTESDPIQYEENFSIYLKSVNDELYIYTERTLLPYGSAASNVGMEYNVYKISGDYSISNELSVIYMMHPFGGYRYVSSGKIIIDYNGYEESYSGTYGNFYDAYNYLSKQFARYGLVFSDVPEEYYDELVDDTSSYSSKNDDVFYIRWNYDDIDIKPEIYSTDFSQYINNTQSGNNQSNTQSDEKTLIAMYKPVLDKFYGYMIAGKSCYDYWEISDDIDNISVLWLEKHSTTTSINQFVPAKVGYAFSDIDSNGVPELIITSDDTSRGKGDGLIYDLYTYKNRKIIHLASSAERFRFYLMDGKILGEGSSSADESYYDVYNISDDGTALSLDFELEYNSTINSNNPYFRASYTQKWNAEDGMIYDEYSDSGFSRKFFTPISEDTYELLLNSLKPVPISIKTFEFYNNNYR